ncbi:hypothetical protein ACLK19_26580 [Escherichia coli]
MRAILGSGSGAADTSKALARISWVFRVAIAPTIASTDAPCSALYAYLHR